MNTTLTAIIITYICSACGYKQSDDPYQPGFMAHLFPEFPGIQDGDCPACYSGKNPQKQRLPSKMEVMSGVDLSAFTQRVASDETLEATKMIDSDDAGLPIMVQTGERETLGIVKGAPAVITEPTFEPKERDLTTKELKELKSQRDQDLDKLSEVLVSEVSTVDALAKKEFTP